MVGLAGMVAIHCTTACQSKQIAQLVCCLFMTAAGRLLVDTKLVYTSLRALCYVGAEFASQLQLPWVLLAATKGHPRLQVTRKGVAHRICPIAIRLRHGRRAGAG